MKSKKIRGLFNQVRQGQRKARPLRAKMQKLGLTFKEVR